MDEAVSHEARIVLAIPLDCLPRSSLVDALHLAASLKAVLRTRLLGGADWAVVSAWGAAHGLIGACDEDGYVFVGRAESVVREAMALDTSPEPHEVPLGLLLGYPPCCCQAIADVKEANIDAFAERARQWAFPGEFSLIDPGGYAEGRALICHLPCSPSCTASLTLAKRALAFLNENPELLAMGTWGVTSS